MPDEADQEVERAGVGGQSQFQMMAHDRDREDGRGEEDGAQ